MTAADTSVVAKVPAQVLRGGNATLRCSYDVGRRDLYSLKWYKGTHEFYSYVPNANEKVRVSPWAAFSIHVRLFVCLFLLLVGQPAVLAGQQSGATLLSCCQFSEWEAGCRLEAGGTHLGADWLPADRWPIRGRLLFQAA